MPLLKNKAGNNAFAELSQALRIVISDDTR